MSIPYVWDDTLLKRKLTESVFEDCADAYADGEDVAFHSEPGWKRVDSLKWPAGAVWCHGQDLVVRSHLERMKRERTRLAMSAAKPLVGRNDPCPCGSGKKYKKCHVGKSVGEVNNDAQVQTD